MLRPTLITAILLLFCVACKDDPEPAVTYPETGLYGDNILFQGKLQYTKRENSFQAIVPAGKSVAIRIKGQNASAAIWTHETGTVSNWTIGTLDRTNDTQTFTSADDGQTCEVKLMFDKGSFVIDYFEHDLSTPNFTKTITVNY
jgi:hypothetical protein